MTAPLVRTFIGCAIVAALAACGSSSTAPTPPNSVTATSSLQFNPSTLTVTRSGAPVTVTWIFQNVAHTVTWDTQPVGASVADIGATSGASVGRDFSVAGTYTYHCSIHSNMTGSITVQ